MTEATVSQQSTGEIKRETTESDDHSIEDFVKATSIDDFLWYNCPKCDFKCKTSPNFIEHIVQTHPYAKSAIEDLTNQIKKKTDQDLQEAEDFILSDLHRDIKESDSESEIEDFNLKKKVKIEEDDNPNREYQCYYCGAMIVGIKNVKEHMRDKHRRFHSKMYGDPRPLNCHSCGATFANEKTQSNHMCTNVDFPVQKDEAGSFECKECGKKFDRRKGYIYHVINSHKADRNFPCEECNYKVC